MSTLAATAGFDPHLDVIAAAVIDRLDHPLDTVSVPNTPDGWDRLAGMCARWEVTVVGIEGASGYGRRLAQTLAGTGIEVREIPTRLTARTRRLDGAGKTDPGDARAIARAAARREGAVWTDRPDSEAVRLLVNHRDSLVAAQTRDINALRAILVEVDPDRAAQLPRLRSAVGFEALTHVSYDGDIHQRTASQLIRELAATCRDRLTQIRDLTRRISDLHHPLTAAFGRIPGVGTVTAAILVAELAGTDGFATDAKLAAWAGTAPLDASSGRQQRHRLNRAGNRQMNRAIHTIALTQLRHHPPARAYLDRRLAEGKTRREAIRSLKRHITRHIWTTLHTTPLT